MPQDAFILEKDHLVPLLRRLGRDRRLVAPVRNGYGDTLYAPVTDLEEDGLDLEARPQNSLKGFFFPQRERLFSYTVAPDTGGGHRYAFETHLPEERPTVYFGVRSCDLFGVLYCDLVFLKGRRRDAYYQRRRAGAVFATLACHHPFAGCFCNATRTGPSLELGFDLQLFDLGDRFYVETGKPGGAEIVARWPAFFQPAGEPDRQAQFQAALEARGLFERKIHVDLAVGLLAGREPEGVVRRLSERCQDCGGCAFVCPTCTCFTITDQPLDEHHGERVRTWDACTFSGFTRMAGDANPVDGATERVRRRFLHKLRHDVARHGRPSCVGCGRCLGICFGGVDMARFVEMVCSFGNHHATDEDAR
ncbi:4Fe-4S ferredoxin [Dissulfurirhabdus thermomarina]|uniref:4Fe-4S ferredoxin n=1 Tax=Dissulfurirhabdus thermomarina TaxID=1765737 RepID=A0A6N9TQZ2_DISTH|nr:4Fe-4S dicluster domain-containing protein [Dissulfurirhabdus thermomarina]NDY41857.1 4Fe-4S ferredoxin [Dissulfurirhabdus thermomarina]NMX22617.1 4Fe-4S ferredoxin [Dissulfurirhabdus thermomarina]